MIGRGERAAARSAPRCGPASTDSSSGGRLGSRDRATAAVIALLLGAGVALEAAHGLQTILVFPDRAVIRNLWGELT